MKVTETVGGMIRGLKMNGTLKNQRVHVGQVVIAIQVIGTVNGMVSKAELRRLVELVHTIILALSTSVRSFRVLFGLDTALDCCPSIGLGLVSASVSASIVLTQIHCSLRLGCCFGRLYT